jgi:DUF971 family protein
MAVPAPNSDTIPRQYPLSFLGGSQMAGSEQDSRVPVRIVMHRVSRVLEIEYGDGRSFRLPFEFLRVHSPSAEVRGHGPGQEVLQTGKAEVGIDAIEPVGNYAIQPRFSDGHATGIYSWDYLYRLGENQESMWQDYLKRLEAAGASRASGTQPSAGTRPGPAAAGAAPIGAKALVRPR